MLRELVELDSNELQQLAQSAGSKGVAWQARTTRWYSLPAGFAFDAFGCGGLPDKKWSTCLDDGRTSSKQTETGTYVGTYQPFPYALPGVAMRAEDEPQAALRVGRIVNAAISLGLLLVALLLLWDRARGTLTLAGLVITITPAVLFYATLLNPTGPEITAAVCFAAALIRLARAPGAPAWVWGACAGSGAMLALSRSLGPFFVLLLALAVAALAGRERTLAAIRAAPRPALLAGATVALAVAGGLFWELRYQPHVPSGPGAIVDGLGPALEELPGLPKEVVGVFGTLNAFMPLTVYIAWWAMFAGLLGAAALLGTRRERLGLATLAVAVVAVTLIVTAIYRQTGFPMQARYVLPFAVLLPLWAGEVLNRHRERLSARATGLVLAGSASAAALFQLVAWYDNARQFALTGAGWRFISHADWVPPLGWWTWVAVATAAAAAYALAGAVAARGLRESR